MTRTWLARATAALIVTAATAVAGCFQDVATCDTLCALPDAPGASCADSCNATQAACTETNALGDFQALLTCVGNTGTYASTTGDCAKEQATVDANCGLVERGTGSDGGGGDGGVVDYDSGTSGLGDSGIDYVDSGYYDSGIYDSGYEDAYYGGDSGIDYDGGVYVDAIAPAGCELGASCGGAGTTCTVVGAGPCGSDQRLMCDGAEYVADGFPCSTSSNVGCGFGEPAYDGGASCSEECSCQNGLEVCTGNCPDAGPANP